LPTPDGTKTVYVWYRDGAGNETGSFSDTIILDTTKPTGTVTYNPVIGTRTSGSVVVTLTVGETITGTPNGRTSGGSNKYTKTYTVKGGETVNFSDVAGNTGSVSVNVANIDKTAPICGTWSYNPTTQTS
jgi:hypothetical protein